ncbi:hypothetical protein IEQ34_001091 [Dendrobium chrysotoxum]|uniref:Uncharacterized protein n=1 Tax=Dendrobium chrysotoxum TaxID=161865 RepID=A0AAV7HPT4_DENCH|nr:hypothetical protein IEQ34_001091 [Dendrobium chrysotoxum]
MKPFLSFLFGRTESQAEADGKRATGGFGGGSGGDFPARKIVEIEEDVEGNLKFIIILLDLSFSYLLDFFCVACFFPFGHIKRRPSNDPVRKVDVLDLTYVKKVERKRRILLEYWGFLGRTAGLEEVFSSVESWALETFSLSGSEEAVALIHDEGFLVRVFGGADKSLGKESEERTVAEDKRDAMDY